MADASLSPAKKRTDAAPSTGFDLDAYLARIGYDGPRTPSLETLRALHLLHPLAIAFENLDPFLGRPVRLDPASLMAKLVHGGRGGYCFEHNLLFLQALKALGFSASGLAARVLWNRPPDTVGPRGHMLLRVELEGKTYIADVGFGVLTLTAPLLLKEPGPQQTPHETFRVVPAGGDYRVEAEIGGERRALYRFDLSGQFEVDYAVTSYFLSTHPDSHFVTGLIAARALPQGRLALLGGRLTVHDGNGSSERETVGSADELATVLEERFGVAVPDRAAFKTVVRDRKILSAGFEQ